jgi:hypothetical protein
VASPIRPILFLRYGLRLVLALSSLARFLDRSLVGGAAVALARVPMTLGRALSRVQSGSLTEYLLLIFTGLAFLVLARLFA